MLIWIVFPISYSRAYLSSGLATTHDNLDEGVLMCVLLCLSLVINLELVHVFGLDLAWNL